MLRFWVWLHGFAGRQVDRLSPVEAYDYGQMTTEEWEKFRAKTERDWAIATDAYFRREWERRT